MATNKAQQVAGQLAAVESELARRRSDLVNLTQAVEKLQEEIDTLVAMRETSLKDVPTSEVLVAIEDMSRAESDLPVLWRSVRQLSKRRDAAAMEYSLADKRRLRLMGAAIATEAAGVLAGSGALDDAQDTLTEVLKLWSRPAALSNHDLKQRIHAAQSSLSELQNMVQAMTG